MLDTLPTHSTHKSTIEKIPKQGRNIARGTGKQAGPEQLSSPDLFQETSDEKVDAGGNHHARFGRPGARERARGS
jgi:hypothetical protein